MRNYIVLILLCFPFFLFGQNQNEIKFDVLGLTLNHYELSYERILNENWGVEVGLRFQNDSRFLDSTNYSIMPWQFGQIKFDETSFRILVHVKHYLFPKPSGNRLMVGGYLIYASKPKVDSGYEDAYQLYKNKAAPEFYSNVIVGLSGGYKFLIKEKIVIEPVIGMGLNISESPLDVGGFGFTFETLLNVKLGYRF